MGYSNDKERVNKSIQEYNPGKEIKVLIVFYDMIADVIGKENFFQKLVNYILGTKTKYFFGVHHTVLLSCTKSCKTKLHTIVYYEDSKKLRGSTNC